MKRASYKCARCHKQHSRAHTLCARCAKPAHAADVIAEEKMIEAIRHAQSYVASLFVGRGEYEKAGAPTIYGALAAAQLLESKHIKSTRRAIIYAVGHDNAATMLTYELIDHLISIAKANQ